MAKGKGNPADLEGAAKKTGRQIPKRKFTGEYSFTLRGDNVTERASPTIYVRRLALELRRLREAAGMTGEEATGKLGWYSAKVSKIETGRIVPAWGDVADLLDVYGVHDEAARCGLIGLARQARQQGWWRSYSDVLSRADATFVGLESSATSLLVYEPLVLPGLLQTEGYARAALAWAPGRRPGRGTVDRQVELRLRRQTVLSGENPLALRAIIGEQALHTGPGGQAVLAGQLRSLAERAQGPSVTLQVLPRGHTYPGAHGAFGIFRFAGAGDHDIGYAETVAGVVYLERKDDLAKAGATFGHIGSMALPPGESLELIREAARCAAVA
jgi:transcriptional regulator with XRE-family HTH domain